MKLICEVNEQDVQYVTEANENGQKDYKIKGVFMQGEIKNRNGRVYPMQVLDEQVKKYMEELDTDKSGDISFEEFSVTGHEIKPSNSDNRELSITGFLKKLPALGILSGSGSLEALIVFIISAT